MNPNLETQFTKVAYKKKGKRKNTLTTISPLINHQFDCQLSIRRILEAKTELAASDIFQSITALLKEALGTLQNPPLKSVVCFGLGRVSELTVPRHQLALLLCLRDLLDVTLLASDPIFNNHDYALLQHFDIHWMADNIEAKYKVQSDTVIFYLPHCPKQLMNNLVWCNWGLQLSKCIIIGNSISKVVEDNSLKVLQKTARYITNILPYMLELGVVNNFKFFEVFNDTSIHVFPDEKLRMLTRDFWLDCEEPRYSDSDVEFIQNAFEKKLVIM